MNEYTRKFSQSGSEETRKMNKVFSSTKRDTNKALEYWTKDKMDKAKPIPLPIKDPRES